MCDREGGDWLVDLGDACREQVCVLLYKLSHGHEEGVVGLTVLQLQNRSCSWWISGLEVCSQVTSRGGRGHNATRARMTDSLCIYARTTEKKTRRLR